ncbi:VanZ family protein [Bacillus sp. AFS017336]|nr:VanZ family protein [Bacillus sp. AFS017336]
MSFFILYFGYRFLRSYITLQKYLYWIIFGVYFTFLIDLTLFPFPYQKYLIQIMIEDRLGDLNNFVPFKGVVDIIRSGSFTIALKQIGGNILLFIPFGLAWPILFPKIMKRKTILIGFSLSLVIELTQGIAGLFLGYNYRSCDIDDLILNTLGTALGIFIYCVRTNFYIKSDLVEDKC